MAQFNLHFLDLKKQYNIFPLNAIKSIIVFNILDKSILKFFLFSLDLYTKLRSVCVYIDK